MDVERDEVVRRLGEEGFVVLDVRSERAGRIAGAQHFDLLVLLALTPDEIHERLGPPEDVELVAYCHSGSRSELAAQILASLGYRASNYRGSWHEWSRDDALPSETG